MKMAEPSRISSVFWKGLVEWQGQGQSSWALVIGAQFGRLPHPSPGLASTPGGVGGANPFTLFQQRGEQQQMMRSLRSTPGLDFRDFRHLSSQLAPSMSPSNQPIDFGGKQLVNKICIKTS